MPWIKDSMKSFSLGVLGKEYKTIHCYDMDGSKIRSPNASFFCDHFSRCAIVAEFGVRSCTVHQVAKGKA